MRGTWHGTLGKEMRSIGTGRVVPSVEVVQTSNGMKWNLRALLMSEFLALPTPRNVRLPKVSCFDDFIALEWPNGTKPQPIPPKILQAARDFTKRQGGFDWQLKAGNPTYSRSEVPDTHRTYTLETHRNGLVSVDLSSASLAAGVLAAALSHTLDVSHINVTKPQW